MTFEMFQVDTKGECLLCQEKCDILYRPGDPRQVSSSTAFRTLLGYLNVNLRNLDEVSTHLRQHDEDEDGADLLISLCSRCTSVTTTFVEWFKVFENACMELNNSYQELRKHIKDPGTSTEVGTEPRGRMMGDNCGGEANSRIAERLRKETFGKCSLGLRSSEPIVAMVGNSSGEATFSKGADSTIRIRVIKISTESHSDSDNAMDSFDLTSPLEDRQPSSSITESMTKGTPSEENKSKMKSRLSGSSTSLKCPHCGKVLSRREHLAYHINHVHGLSNTRIAVPQAPRLQEKERSEKLQCSRCNVRFREVAHLDRHFREVHLKVQANCAHCPKSFSRKERLKHHMMLHHPLIKFAERFPWKPTSKEFHAALEKVVEGRQRTVGVGERVRHVCPRCTKSFKDTHGLRVHALQVHFDQVLRQMDVAKKKRTQNGEDAEVDSSDDDETLES